MNWSVLPIENIDWAGTLSWPKTNKPALIALATGTLSYPISHYMPWMFPRLLRAMTLTERQIAIAFVVLSRLWGALALGVPAVWVAVKVLPQLPNHFGANLHNAGLSLTLTLIACVAAAVLLALLTRIWPGFFTGYPEIHVYRWTFGLKVLNTISWLVYLIPYEFLLRGLLLFTLASAFGGAIAIAVTAFLDSLIRRNEPQEQIATLVLAVLFGFISLWTGSLLAPLLIHLFITSATELFALRARPYIRFGRAFAPTTV